MTTPDYMNMPEYITDPKFGKFLERIEKLEATGDDIGSDSIIRTIPDETIQNRWEEARLAYANANNNTYPSTDSDAGKRVNRAATEARTRNLYHALRIFEKSIEPQDSDSTVMDAPPPDIIMKNVLEFRTRVTAMTLTERQAAVFYEHANHYAAEAMRRGGTPEENISELLGSNHRPRNPRQASPEPQEPRT